VASSLLSERGYVNVYDFLYNSVDEDNLKPIKFLFKDDSVKIKISKVKKQCDCGLFAIVKTVHLSQNIDPTH